MYRSNCYSHSLKNICEVFKYHLFQFNFFRKKVMNFIYCCKTMNKYLQGITIVVAYIYITIIPNHCKYSYYLKDMNLFKLKRNSIIFKSFLHILFIFQTEKHRCSTLVLTCITVITLSWLYLSK